jgi:hypothetical protein|tara:strand:+ start:38 stop:463 length:426 start_codon:yes stop_codon:yes gene_type:complete
MALITKPGSAGNWRQSGGSFELTVAMEGTGSASAYIIGSQIYVDCAAAQSAKWVGITIPFDLILTDQRNHLDGTTSSTIQAYNGASQIMTVAATGTTEGNIKRATVCDTTYWAFSKGDTDLYLEVTTAAFTGVVVLDFLAT